MYAVEAAAEPTCWSAAIPPRPVERSGTPANSPESDRSERFRRLLSQFQPIGLAEMDGVALLDRIDTKYVMSVGQMYDALAGLSNEYRVLEVGGERLNRYRTVYFDTADFQLYGQHHAGKPHRYKVRSRLYVETDTAFLEVKRRSKRDRTTKSRIRTAGLVTELAPDAARFVESTAPVSSGLLEPKLTNAFCRITLVGIRHRERVTLDLGLHYGVDGRTIALPELAIAEVKQAGVDRDSAFVRRMRAAGIRPGSFSKYCMGIALLYSEVKHNRFKPGLRLVESLHDNAGAA